MKERGWWQRLKEPFKGELDGELGIYGLARGKMAQLMGLGAAMLAHGKWSEFWMRHFVGKAALACGFAGRSWRRSSAFFRRFRRTLHLLQRPWTKPSWWYVSPDGRGLGGQQLHPRDHSL